MFLARMIRNVNGEWGLSQRLDDSLPTQYELMLGLAGPSVDEAYEIK